MTRLEISWLAAVLTPRDIAPHPNFSDEVASTPAAMLASLLAPWGPRRLGVSESEEQSPEDDFLEACRQSMTFGTVESGAQALSGWARSSMSVDLGRSVAAALLASVAYGELDQHDQAISLLSELVQSIRSSGSGADAQIALAAVLQQRALRLFEVGQTGETDADEVARLVADVNYEEVSTFPLSRSASWTSEDTCRDIAEALADAARSHLAGLRDALSGSWLEVVKARPPFLLLKEGRRRADGYEEYLGSDYESALGAGTWRLGGSARGDTPIYQALLFTELLGHPVVRARRSELAVVLFLSSVSEKNEIVQEEALRLFRHGQDKKRLTRAVRRVRAAGPLVALRRDALKVVDQRVPPRRLLDVDLIVLEAAAELLTKGEAALALDAVLECLHSPFQLQNRAWQAESVRLESVWPAAIALSLVADRLDEVTFRLLSQVKETVGSDQLLDRLYARTVDAVEWERVSTGTTAAWRQWSSGDSPSEFPLLLSSLRWQLRLPEHPPGLPAGPEVTLEALANFLNGVMHERVEWPKVLSHPAQTLVRDHLRSIRRQAAEGTFSGGGLHPADIGVGLAFYADVDLWDDLSAFLTDPLVQRDDKTHALERIAREPDKVPSAVADALSARLDQLLSTAPKDYFGPPVIDPYPSALRAAAALGAITADRLLTECARLAGSAEATTRVEAARTLGTMSSRPTPPDWTVVLALQFSRDADAGVRAEAARCLALLLGEGSQQRILIEDRLVGLLSEDGILVPILVVRGLTHVKDRVLPDRVIRSMIGNLAKSHPASGVRVAAAAYLTAQRDDVM